MINPTELPVDVEELQAWANGYKDVTGLSWQKFGLECGIPGGTLQPWCKGTYQGDMVKYGRMMFQFRQSVHSRTDRSQGIPTDPGYFPTPTSKRVMGLLRIAQTGRITFGAMGAGLGKSRTAEEFVQRARPVWMATMRESSKRVNSMIAAVEKALGHQGRYVRSHEASEQVINKMRGQRGTLIIDEANHLQYEAFEEIRGWHDATGVGICFLGNEELLARIESGRRRDAFARLNSRIAQRLVQNLPLDGDVDAFCDAWNLADPGMRQLLWDIAMVPGSGGLRECRQVVESGCMIAADDGDTLTLSHLKEAADNRATRLIR